MASTVTGRFGKQGEELRKFRLHLRDVVAEVVEDLLRGGRNVFGIGFERRAEEARSAKPSFLAIAVISASMRSISRRPSWWISSGRHVRGGAGVDVVLVALLAVRREK